MIGVFFEPRTTKVCNASFLKGGRVIIDYHQVLRKSYTGLFASSGDDDTWDEDEAVYMLADFFRALKKDVRETRDGIYIVIPDYLFIMVKCLRWQTQDDFLRELASALPVPLDDVYYTDVMKSNPDNQENISSVYAIERRIIDCFYQASIEAGVIIRSIEAASVGFFRGNSKFDIENFIAEIYAEHACGVYFSVVAGIFKADLSDLAYSKLFRITPTEANAAILSAFALNDMSANTIYEGFVDEDVPYTFFTDDKSIFELDNFRERMDINKSFPDYIQSNIPENSQLDWLPLIGSMLQDYPDQARIYSTLPTYAAFGSGNIISADMKYMARMELMKKKIISIARKASAGIAAIAMIEAAAGLYFSSSSIPSALQEDYNAALENSKLIDAEFAVIEAEKNEHMDPVAVYMDILGCLPDSCLISSLEIENPMKDKKAGGNFVKLSAFSGDPVQLQNFAAALTASGRFGNVSISKLTSDNSDISRADFVITKGAAGN